MDEAPVLALEGEVAEDVVLPEIRSGMDGGSGALRAGWNLLGKFPSDPFRMSPRALVTARFVTSGQTTE